MKGVVPVVDKWSMVMLHRTLSKETVQVVMADHPFGGSLQLVLDVLLVGAGYAAG